MNVQTMNLVFGSLAALVNAFVVVTLLLWLFSRQDLFVKFRDMVGPNALWIGFAVAAVTMAGSLYYSEYVNFEPCKLCWFQRIALYPMTIIMLVAALRKDVLVKFYVVPVLVVGALVSIYHYQYEWFPGQESTFCSVVPGETPCNVTWFRSFGFMSLAYMALSSALVMIALVLLARRGDDDEAELE